MWVPNFHAAGSSDTEKFGGFGRLHEAGKHVLIFE
jgi:hypothetical protein